MRGSMICAALVAVAAPMFVGAPAAQAGKDLFVAPERGIDFPKGMRKWDDKRRGACEGEQSLCGDPYAYRYIKRAWYPYHSSRYWVSAEEMRYRYRYEFTGPKYTFHPAWGASDGHRSHDSHDGKPIK